MLQTAKTPLLYKLKEEYIIKSGNELLLLERDELLQSHKYEYGEELNWVIPNPGDWHLLKNYQLPLMKAAGLKAIAKLGK